jgi:hypothetical protein
MNAKTLANELITGLHVYYQSQQIFSNEEISFFLFNGHRMASDDLRYDEFESIFPNYWEYRNHSQEILEILCD